MHKQWFVLRSKPHKEWLLYDQLLARGVECFFPSVTVTPVNPRSATERPLFPSYMFVHCELDVIGSSYFKWMPYAQGLVTFDAEPAAIPDNLIVALKNRVGEINQKGGLHFTQIEQGTAVQIVDGPLRGYDGVFDMRLDEHARVRILVNLMNNRQMTVDLNVGQIKPQKKKS